MSENTDAKRYRDRISKFFKGAVRRGVNLTVEQRFRVIVQELFEYEGEYDPEIVQFFDHFLASSSKNAHDIMVPRSRMVSVSASMSLQKIVEIIKETGHSRYPILGDSPEAIVGVLHAKDLFTKFGDDDEQVFDIESVRREVQTVPQDQSIISLLQEFKHSHMHIAVVEDEFGDVVGVVTMEDVFEQFFGEIQDEHDRGKEAELLIESDGANRSETSNGETTVKADLSIDEFNEHFGSSLSNDQSNTIGGYVVTKLGHVPQKGEKTRADDLLIEIVEASARRIERISVLRNGQ